MTQAVWLILALAVRPPSATDSACARARYMLLNRHVDRTRLDSAETWVARIRQNEPHDAEALLLWIRVQMQRGDDADVRSERISWYRAALDAADTVRRAFPRNPDGHLWWAVARGRIAQTEGVAKSLGVAAEMRRALEKALQLDSSSSLVWYALARLHEELPGIMGGSRRRAEECLRRGVECDPGYTVIRLGLAELLASQNRLDEAREQLVLLLAVAGPTEPAEFALRDRPIAESLLSRLGRN